MKFLPGDRTAWISAASGAALMLAAGLAVLFWPDESYPAMKADCNREELFVAGGTDVSLKNQRRALIRKWNEERYADGRPHPHATLVEVSDSTDLQHSQIKAVQESGSCAYDVLIMDNTWTAQFAEGGYLRPLDDIGGLGDFFPAALRTGERDGKQYAVPFNVDVGLLYFHEGRTPPTEWSRLLSSGIALQLADYDGLTVNALEAVWNDDGEGLLTGDDRPSVEELRTKVYPALERLTSPVRGPLAPSRQFDEPKSIEAFASGTGLMRNWPYAFSSLATEPRMRAPDGGRLRFGVRALPGRTVLGGQNLAVSAKSPNPDAAADLVEFLSGTDSQRLLFSCGGFAPGRYSALGLTPERRSPAHVNVQTCWALTDEPPPAPGETELPDHAQLTQLGQAVITALARAEPRPVTPHYSTFSSTFRGCVQKIFDQKGTDAESFARAVNRSLDGQAASC
ncbi:extracellular solute-binding protein [Actinomadura sp. 1N219]|uniref:extracellular solute-binding protein n=1 Tax=Actinomadura sp. 1N219 TaxID=3375152 RepID=UPI0037B52509